MTDLHQALAEIHAIRGQIARSAQFRGYAPAPVAATGVLALLVAGAQALLVRDPAHDIAGYLTIWISTAVLALGLTSVQTVRRTRRLYPGLAGEMILSAVDRFLPPALAGLLVTLVLIRSAPQSLWMLPGLWQIMFSLGIFSSCKLLPRPMFALGVWYLGAGLACLAIGSRNGALSPWAMGIPFGVGQILVAVVLQLGYRNIDERT